MRYGNIHDSAVYRYTHDQYIVHCIYQVTCIIIVLVSAIYMLQPDNNWDIHILYAARQYLVTYTFYMQVGNIW